MFYDLKPTTIERPNPTTRRSHEKEIWLAGGCFWGTEEYLSGVSGVLATAVGYANGNVLDPSYEAVCKGNTSYGEAVYVLYDSNQIGLGFLLSLYYKSINPTSLNRQGGDIGTQYRTGIYYTDHSDLPVIETSLSALAESINKPIAIEVWPLSNFFLAEEPHQRYLQKNPHGYCHISPSLFDYAKIAKDYDVPTQKELKKKLSLIEYEVTQNSGTELPFSHPYDKTFQPGIYVDITTGEPLFFSTDKFEAGCGWPAFSRPIHDAVVTGLLDTSHGRLRTEIRSSHSGAHLGHVFEDGPTDLGGLRYCINGASLSFVPLSEMREKGYDELIPLLTQQEAVI